LKIIVNVIDQTSRPASDEARLAAALLRQTLLARATELARAGRYAEARGLLSEAPEDGACLDLLARIHAQQGNLSEAEACWIEAARLAPGRDAYRAELARIASLQNRSAPRSRLLLPGLIVLAIAAVGIALFVPIAKREPNAKIAVSVARPQTTSASDGPPDVRIAVPGVSLKPDGSALVVAFDEGLFKNGSVLKPKARILLASVGRQLQPHAGRIAVAVIGHTDNWPMPPGRRYRDNAALGLARAAVAVEHLRAIAHLPTSMLSAAAADEATTPYPNDTPVNRARNRTVVMRIYSISR